VPMREKYARMYLKAKELSLAGGNQEQVRARPAPTILDSTTHFSNKQGMDSRARRDVNVC